MKKYARLYLYFVAQYMKSLMEYKVDFLVGFFCFFVVEATGIAFIYLIFQHIPLLNGWNFYELVFVYGFAQLPRGIDHFFTDNLWMLSDTIILKGEFDKYLLRPINPLFQVLAEVVQPDGLGEVIIGVILIAIAVPHLSIQWSVSLVICFIILVLCGSVIYTSIKLLFSSIAFWIKQSQAILFICYRLSDFGKYPLSIYGKFVRFLITMIIPFAFVAIYPASFILGKLDMTTTIIGSGVATIISFCLAYTVWRFGIRAYESAGN